MRLLQERWVFALATLDDDGLPYATPLFYAAAVLPGSVVPIVVFASRADTCHGRAIGDGPAAVGAALYLETEVIGEVRGLQLRGELVVCSRLHADAAASLRAAYLERHPVAAAHLGERDRLYALAVTWAKLTDNRIGFGKRLVWTFEPPWRGEFPAGPGEQTALR